MAWKPYGHVAHVETVTDKDHWTVSHANMRVGPVCEVLDGIAIRVSPVTRKGNDVALAQVTQSYRL